MPAMPHLGRKPAVQHRLNSPLRLLLSMLVPQFFLFSILHASRGLLLFVAPPLFLLAISCMGHGSTNKGGSANLHIRIVSIFPCARWLLVHTDQQATLPNHKAAFVYLASSQADSTSQDMCELATVGPYGPYMKPKLDKLCQFAPWNKAVDVFNGFRSTR